MYISAYADKMFAMSFFSRMYNIQVKRLVIELCGLDPTFLCVAGTYLNQYQDHEKIAGEGKMKRN